MQAYCVLSSGRQLQALLSVEIKREIWYNYSTFPQERTRMAFNENVALVTGGTRGIGRAIAEHLAALGAKVVVAATTAQTAQDVAARIAELCNVQTLGLKVDVSNAASVAEAFATVKETFGRLDILVNNAGITRDGLLLRMKEDDWDAVMDVNLKSAFLCSKEAVKLMSKQRYGRIVNVSSVVGFMGNAGQANYCAAKAGMMGLTKSLAREYASRGITCNAVAPGFIVTAMTDALNDAAKQEIKRQIPSGELGKPEDVAHAVGFLAAPEAGYITGQVIHVNGGMYM